MPSPSTVLQFIEDALGLTNSVGADQTLTARETSDCLRVYNDLLEQMSTQGMSVYGQANQTFNTIANQAVYSIGAGGDFNTVWPASISEPAYATIQGVTFPYTCITQQDYNLIGYKAQSGGGTDLAQFYLYVNAFPLGQITLWPVPSAIFPITFTIGTVLTAVTSASQTVTYPVGYAKAFKYALAVEYAPMFGKQITKYPDVLKIHIDTMADIKRMNYRPRVLRTDPALMGNRNAGNWRG